MGSGLIIFWGKIAPSGIPIAKNTVSIKVTPIANTRSSLCQACRFLFETGLYGVAWCVVYIDVVDLLVLVYGLIGFSDTVTAFFGTVGICSVSALLIVVSPGRVGLSLLAMEVFVERR
jgi:hypothetical protein